MPLHSQSTNTACGAIAIACPCACILVIGPKHSRAIDNLRVAHVALGKQTLTAVRDEMHVSRIYPIAGSTLMCEGKQQ